MITPLIKTGFMHTAMYNLQFASVIGQFGMFFLHDLQTSELTLKEISSDDPDDVRAIYGQYLRPRKQKNLRRLRILNTGFTEDYPWGENPSWPRIQQLLLEEPTQFIRHWDTSLWMDLPEYGICHQLFISFTRELWLAVAESVVATPILPNPLTLEDAMKVWSVGDISALLGEERAVFLPSCDALSGQLPRSLKRSCTFADRRRVFFPDPDKRLHEKSIWKTFTIPGAYIHSYYEYLEGHSQNDIDDLHANLDKIFSLIQCLPATHPQQNNEGPIWSSVAGKIQLVTNSKCYRMKKIGTSIQQAPGRQIRPQTSIKILEARMVLEHQGIPISQTLKRKRQVKERSLVKNNRRRPPTNNRRGKKRVKRMSTRDTSEGSSNDDEEPSSSTGFQSSSTS